jgi:hypothetical protein
MKSARLPHLMGLVAVAGSLSCAPNDQSMSILQLQAVEPPSCVATAMAGGSSTPGLSRGLLDLGLVTDSGYIAAPVVRNDLVSLTMGPGSVEFNGIQVTGVNVKLDLSSDVSPLVPSADQSFFVPAAGGHIDPDGLAAFFVEILPARIAKEMKTAVPKGGVLTLIVEVSPVGMRGGSQVVGGPIYFPIDLCVDCLVSDIACPFPAGTTVEAGGCFPAQDVPTQCCTDKTGTTLCGASAPVATTM